MVAAIPSINAGRRCRPEGTARRCLPPSMKAQDFRDRGILRRQRLHRAQPLGENAGAVKQLLIERHARWRAASRVNLRRFMPMMLRPSRLAYWPLTRPNGITSPRTPQTPPTITCGPIRVNWCTADEPADEDKIADLAMAAERGRGRKDHVIADLAVVADMAAVHEIAALADARHAAARDRAGVHGDGSPDGAAGADLEPGQLAAIAQRLRRRAERDEWVDRAAVADRGLRGDVDMADQLAVLADHDVGPMMQ